MNGLYPIVDLDALNARGIPVLVFARGVLVARPALLQLRAKQAAPREVVELLRALRPLCDPQITLLFANDRPDLAAVGGADGVHVGQDDLPVKEVRRAFPQLKVGVSTHDLAQVEAAIADQPDYLAYGPVFETQSKADADTSVGIESLKLATARSRIAGIPMVAIGGINAARAPAIAEAGAMGAVIAALFPPVGASGNLEELIAARAVSLQALLSQRL